MDGKKKKKKQASNCQTTFYYCYAIVIQPIGSAVEVSSFSKYG